MAIGDIGAHSYSFSLVGPLSNCLFLGNFVMNCGVPDGSGVGGFGFACTYPTAGTGVTATNVVLRGNTVIDNRGAPSSTPGVGTGTQFALYGDGHFFGVGCIVQDNDALGSFLSAAPIQPNPSVAADVIVEGYLLANTSDQIKTFQSIAVQATANANILQGVTLRLGSTTVGVTDSGYQDFYSSGGGVLNSDGRILVTGGTPGTPFNGLMIFYGSGFALNNIHVHGSYANDAAAAAAGIPIDCIYRNGSALQVRVS